MYKSTYTPNTYYPSSMGFIRETSPNRFRTTMGSGQFCERAQLSKLRNSFSSTSIKSFNQLFMASEKNRLMELQSKNKSQRKEQFSNLKSTLEELEKKIKSTKFDLFNKSNQKKNKFNPNQQHLLTVHSQKKIPSPPNDTFYDKNRQTVSTDFTSTYKNDMKISQYITSEPKPLHYHQSLSNPYDSKGNSLYYISEAVRAVNEKNSLAMEHINGSIRMIKSCSQFYNDKSSKKYKMDLKEKDKNKKTLVLDLDQTLIHCYENTQIKTDIKLNITIEGLKVQIGVNIRPYAMTFLKRMCKKFQIVVFTASHQVYANAILNELDPLNELISHRLYRQHCLVLPNQLHVKDLRCLSRDLKDIILVDNAAYSYSFQLQNGVPILPYYEGKDYELPVLQNYLQKLEKVDDVRELNRRYFKLEEYSKFESAQDVVKQLYVKK